MVPQTSLKHDNSHIHRALPVRRLLPEQQQTIGKLAKGPHDHACAPTATMEELPMAKG